MSLFIPKDQRKQYQPCMLNILVSRMMLSLQYVFIDPGMCLDVDGSYFSRPVRKYGPSFHENAHDFPCLQKGNRLLTLRLPHNMVKPCDSKNYSLSPPIKLDP